MSVTAGCYLHRGGHAPSPFDEWEQGRVGSPGAEVEGGWSFVETSERPCNSRGSSVCGRQQCGRSLARVRVAEDTGTDITTRPGSSFDVSLGSESSVDRGDGVA